MMSQGELRIYRALYLNKEGLHIRDISKKAKLTLPAVVKHINKGEKNGIVFCKITGRMKICRLIFGSKTIISILNEVELARFNELSKTIKDSLTSFIEDLQEKPLIALIFGSYVSGNQTKNSDLDILLVYQRIDTILMKKIENSATKIRGRTNVSIEPVGISYDEFQKEIMNIENEFMKDIRKSAMIIHGIDSYLNVVKRFYS
ncbi:MAG: nucleotidyltransferase domain-containing protein [Candidatus Aenigmatarchaeota archaeon]